MSLDHTLSCNIVFNKIFGDDGILPLDTILAHGNASPFPTTSCPLVTLVYQIPDVLELRQVVNAKQTQNKCQENKNKNLQFKMVEETEDFDDLVLFPGVTDTEDNIPKAMINFLDWVSKSYRFDFVLITNDEAFVAVDKIMSRLDSNVLPANAWISNFRKFVAVKAFGDLFEKNYASTHYPVLPASSGSLLSKDLVKYLSANVDHFSPFRTLTSSLAVWLAPLVPSFVDDLSWGVSNDSCSKTTVAMGPLIGVQAMTEVYQHYQTCGQLCPCKNS